MNVSGLQVNGVKEREQRLRRLQMELGRARLVARPWEAFQRAVCIVPPRDLSPPDPDPGFHYLRPPPLPEANSAACQLDVGGSVGDLDAVPSPLASPFLDDVFDVIGSLRTAGSGCDVAGFTAPVKALFHDAFVPHSQAPSLDASHLMSPNQSILSPIREESLSRSTSLGADAAESDPEGRRAWSSWTSPTSVAPPTHEESGVGWKESGGDLSVADSLASSGYFSALESPAGHEVCSTRGREESCLTMAEVTSVSHSETSKRHGETDDKGASKKARSEDFVDRESSLETLSVIKIASDQPSVARMGTDEESGCLCKSTSSFATESARAPVSSASNIASGSSAKGVLRKEARVDLGNPPLQFETNLNTACSIEEGDNRSESETDVKADLSTAASDTVMNVSYTDTMFSDGSFAVLSDADRKHAPTGRLDLLNPLRTSAFYVETQSCVARVSATTSVISQSPPPTSINNSSHNQSSGIACPPVAQTAEPMLLDDVDSGGAVEEGWGYCDGVAKRPSSGTPSMAQRSPATTGSLSSFERNEISCRSPEWSSAEDDTRSPGPTWPDEGSDTGPVPQRRDEAMGRDSDFNAWTASAKTRTVETCVAATPTVSTEPLQIYNCTHPDAPPNEQSCSPVSVERQDFISVAATLHGCEGRDEERPTSNECTYKLAIEGSRAAESEGDSISAGSDFQSLPVLTTCGPGGSELYDSAGHSGECLNTDDQVPEIWPVKSCTAHCCHTLTDSDAVALSTASKTEGYELSSEDSITYAYQHISGKSNIFDDHVNKTSDNSQIFFIPHTQTFTKEDSDIKKEKASENIVESDVKGASPEVTMWSFFKRQVPELDSSVDHDASLNGSISMDSSVDPGSTSDVPNDSFQSGAAVDSFAECETPVCDTTQATSLSFNPFLPVTTTEQNASILNFRTISVNQSSVESVDSADSRHNEKLYQMDNIQSFLAPDCRLESEREVISSQSERPLSAVIEHGLGDASETTQTDDNVCNAKPSPENYHGEIKQVGNSSGDKSVDITILIPAADHVVSLNTKLPRETSEVERCTDSTKGTEDNLFLCDLNHRDGDSRSNNQTETSDAVSLSVTDEKQSTLNPVAVGPSWSDCDLKQFGSVSDDLIHNTLNDSHDLSCSHSTPDVPRFDAVLKRIHVDDDVDTLGLTAATSTGQSTCTSSSISYFVNDPFTTPAVALSPAASTELVTVMSASPACLPATTSQADIPGHALLRHDTAIADRSPPPTADVADLYPHDPYPALPGGVSHSSVSVSHTSVSVPSTSCPAAAASLPAARLPSSLAKPRASSATATRKVLPTSRPSRTSNGISHLLRRWEALETAADSASPKPPAGGSGGRSSQLETSRHLSKSTPELKVAEGLLPPAHQPPAYLMASDDAAESRETFREVILSKENRPVIYGSTGDLPNRSAKVGHHKADGSPQTSASHGSDVSSARSRMDSYKMPSLDNLNVVLITPSEASNGVSPTSSSVTSARHIDSAGANEVQETVPILPSVNCLIARFSDADSGSDLSRAAVHHTNGFSRKTKPRSGSVHSSAHYDWSPALSTWLLSSSSSPSSVRRKRTVSYHGPSDVPKEEELRQDGRTLYKTKEEKSYNETRHDGKPTEGYGSGDVTDHGHESDLAREHREKEDFHFQEMSSVKSQFERGPQQPQPQPRKQIDIRQEVASVEAGVYESQPQTFQPQYGEDETEEGVYENSPEQRSDVVRESDRNVGAELPSVGTAKNIREKFLSGKVEKAPTMKREMTPPEIVSGGVYESQPKYNPDVVHAGEPVQEEILPEHGMAKNLAAKFKQMEKQGSVPLPSQKREITPDRTTKVEYVSEPRGHVERYEPEIQAGIFESQPATRDDVVKSDQAPEEILPERGAAKNIANKFKQLTSEQSSAASPRSKRELTPDTTGRVEYVSEPTGYVERYEGKAESGVFESQPAEREDVVKSDQLPEEILPERGTARSMAARFKEMEKSTSKSPATPGKYKEFTPPRENGTPTHGVYESTPQVAADVVHSEDSLVDVKPERGTARNIADKFRQLGSSENTPKSPRTKKEFTPPPQTQAVYENTPKQFIPDYNRPPESGILESKPEVREDVVRCDSLPNYEQELPERGCTRNLVSAWRQRESESSKISPTGSAKPKEFTPPREEPRIASQRNQPRTPKSPMARGGDMDVGSVNPMDLPGQYQPQAEPTVFESEPQKLEGVVSENDTDWNAGLPKADTTKKMLAKFQQIQAQAQADTSSPKPQPQARKEGGLGQSNESSPEKVGRSKSMRVAVQLEKCGACDKTVYAMEKIEIEKHSYHKSCFRCSHCHCVLTPKTFAINQKVMFCTTHYKQLFATKGNYDEGFGHDQHKKRWKSEPNLADDEQQQQHSNHT